MAQVVCLLGRALKWWHLVVCCLFGGSKPSHICTSCLKIRSPIGTLPRPDDSAESRGTRDKGASTRRGKDHKGSFSPSVGDRSDARPPCNKNYEEESSTKRLNARLLKPSIKSPYQGARGVLRVVQDDKVSWPTNKKESETYNIK